MKKLLIILFISLFLFASSSYGAPIKLQWKANTEPDLAGYMVHWGDAHRTYSSNASVVNVTTYEITGLGVGTYYIAVTAYDNAIPPNISDFSYEVVKEIKMPPPQELEIIE